MNKHLLKISTVLLWLCCLTLNLSAQSTSFLVNYQTGANCDGEPVEGCRVAAGGADYGSSFSCGGSIGSSSLDSYQFADPLPPNVTLTQIEIEFYGACNDLSGGNYTYSINGTDIETNSGFITSCSCTCPAVAPSFTLSNPTGIPGYVYGGMNTFEMTSDESICAYYSNVTFTYIVNPTCLTMPATVTLDGTGNASAVAGADIDNGSSGDSGNAVSLSTNSPAFTCADIGPNTVTLTVTDDVTGAVSTCDATVTVQDTQAPVLDCSGITTTLTAGANCTALSEGAATIFDNCSPVSVDFTFTGPDGTILSAQVFPLANNNPFDASNLSLPLGATILDVEITDQGGNTDDCSVTINVLDMTPPMAMCQDITLDLNTSGVVTANAAAVNDGSTDNCTASIDLNFSLDITDFECADVGANTVELTVSDGAVPMPNTATCNAVITIQDLVDPDANCQAMPVLLDLDVSGNGTITPFDIDDNSSDACGIAFFSLSATTFVCGDVGDNLVVLTVTDNNNNSETCTSVVTVRDLVLPEAICMDALVNLDADGNGSIVVADIDNVSNDACGIMSLVLDNEDFFCANVGDNTVTLTVTDNNGNVQTCDAVVAVEDNVLPEAICMDALVMLDDAGNGSITPADIDNGSNDACGIMSLVLDNEDFFCANVGDNTVTLTVTDNNGNEQTCDATVTVEDNVPPEAICMDATVNLDNDGNGSIVVADIDNGTNDACGIASLVLDNTDFTCANVGPNGVVLTATDVNGNVATCSAIVTVQDLIPAIIECRQPISTVTTPGVCGKNDLTVLEPFSIYDNCGAENVTFTRLPAGNNFPVGTTTLDWTATDANGNISTCQSLVIVEDNELPTVASCNSVIDFIDPGSCTAQVTVSTEIFDNCGVASIEGTGTFTLPFGLYPNPITVTDVNGNVTVHDFTIYIHDDQAPEFANCPEETITLQAGADGTANYPAQTPVAVDNCGVPTITNDLPEGGLPLGSNVVTFVAEDAYGNTSDCVVNVEVSGGISLHPVSDIESSLAEDETAQTIAWNALNAGTICELCEETSLEGFRYVGTWWGHQYFLADESSLTRDEANLIAEGYDAHLAVINDLAENNYLTEALDEEIRSAWIGLLPQMVEGEWTFMWDNGDVLDFEALAFEEVNADTRIILGNDGTWKAATIEEDKFFLIERPCINFEQTGPIYTPEVVEGEEEIPGVLLRSGDVWPQGEHEVTYALTDMCGNEAVMNFDVDVLPELAEYCTSSGVDNSVWVEKFIFHDLANESASNEGYADFTEETTTMNIGDGVILVRMEAGGNEAEEMLYWNIYMDANADGDFYDAGEMLYQVASREDIEANLTLPVVSVENARLRVMVSRYAFAAPCGDTYVGEIEDYNLNLLIPEDYARAACEVDVAGLNGVRNGFAVDLDWTVNSVCPIDRYTIESSVDGVNFVEVTQIEETDFSDLIYTKDYTTNLPAMIGTVTYRIKVQAEDQAAFYTNAVSFRMNSKPNSPILHPNPADTYVSVALGDYVGQTGTVVIYDNLGKVRLMQKFDASTGDAMSLNLLKFIDGIYHVSIEADGKRIKTQRLVIDKLYGWSPAK